MVKKKQDKRSLITISMQDMPESVDRIDGRTAVSDIISYQKGNYLSLILFFFIILYHLLDCKILSDQF